MKHYAKRDHMAQDAAGNYYSRHVSAMTAEALHAKSDIAGELAHRDMEIERLREDAEMLRWLANEWDKNGTVDFRRYAHGTAGCVLFTVTTQHVRGYGFRGAIEAAMREQGANTNSPTESTD